MQGFRTKSRMVVVVCAVIGTVGVRAEAQWHYYYFDEATPLTLDPTRVAVRLQGSNAGGISGVVTGADAGPLVAAGWDLLPLADGGVAGDSASHVADVGAATGYASPVFLDAAGGPVVITPDVLIGFHDGVSADRAEQILASVRTGRITQRRFGGMDGAYRLASGRQNGFEVLIVANTLAQLPEVEFAEPNMVFTGHNAGVPTDPFFPDAWGLDNTGQFGGTPGVDMSALDGWLVTTGDPAVIIVVIDSGVELTHPDLNQFTPGTDTTSDASTDGGPVNQFDDHGTTVAGCISGIIDNGIGAVGIAPDCRTASARTFIHINGAGNWISESSWTVDTLAWAESIGAKVTNNSNCYAVPSSAISAKYASSRANGIVHFASSCNDGSSVLGYPSSLPSVNAVGAIDATGARAAFSNVGNGLALVAPGVDIITTDRLGAEGFSTGDFAFVQGTSYASPYAAGVAALLIAANPGITPGLVEAALQESAVDLGAPGYDIVTGHGLVDAGAALQWQIACASLEPTLPEAVPATKNRYVSFTPPQDGQSRAIRFTLEDLPAPHDVLNGTELWVGEPASFIDSPALGTQFFGAQLQCTPAFRDWSDVDVLHIFGPAIMPGADYRTETVLESCFELTTTFPSYFSASAFSVTAQTWGDMVSPFSEDSENIQPDFRDIKAAVSGFLDDPEAPLTTNADLVPATPDQLVNFRDIAAVVDAFLGGGYMLDGPTACP